MSRTRPTPRRTTLLAAGLALAAAVPLAAVVAPSAHAQSIVVRDPARDLRFVPQRHSGDLVKIRVTHGRHNLKALFKHASTSSTTDVYLIWVDTDRRNPGPEYRIAAHAEVESADVTRVDDWERQSGTELRCPGAAAEFSFDDAPSPVRVIVPRSCLGRPDRVRVSLATEPDFPFRRIDWAPGVERFGRWVESGPVRR